MSFCNDNFTGADGTNLTAHTSDSGHTWTNTASFGGTILLDGSGGVFSSNAGEAYLINATPASADYDVQATIACLSVKNNKV